jgi:hypothetical protein
MYVLIVQYPGYDLPPVAVHGPFETVEDAQAYAERYRERNDLPGPATPENNEVWTDKGWYFGIERPDRDVNDVLPGGNT